MGKIVFAMSTIGKTSCAKTRNDFIDFDEYKSECRTVEDKYNLLIKMASETDKPIFCSDDLLGYIDIFDLAIILPKEVYVKRIHDRDGLDLEFASEIYNCFISKIRVTKCRKFLTKSYLSNIMNKIINILNEDSVCENNVPVTEVIQDKLSKS